MINAKSLLDQFMGSGGASGLGEKAQSALGGGMSGGMSGALGGAAAGGLLALLVSSKGARKIGGKALTYGGAAAVGALAFRAWQNYQQGKAPGAADTPTEPLLPPKDSAFDAENSAAADGLPFPLTLVRTMIAAAKADGHVDAEEQKKLFDHVDRQGFDNETKAWMFDELRKEQDVAELARAAQGPEQAAEIYLAARMTIDPDDPQEQRFLRELSARLDLPGELVQHLDAEVEAQARA
ncbi:tellurite resistance TerB family protein [Aquibaculum arenosum]|uniref:Tellurite resistance TerB family protein n=1 Tax=Aquibaculum arenosum TaxID=3032591 RepID=A0ABT5YIK5_9PROT|nr:tellurite resistance TerB family protein [Fodinicurvata sp. CAU 1616]MDF2094770.1 tellurite resistance TerB family protein [Fodinicurvata sp. CAU 1616]